MNTTISSLSGLIVAALFLADGASTLRADSPQLASAKKLYAQASYEEALVQLNAIADVDLANQVDQYRALCLLALGRDREAQAPLERIVVRAPRYVVPADDASPKLVTLFQQVRARTLPAAAKDLYAKAKTSFDGRHFTEARTQFEEMLVMLNEAGLDDPGSPVADLKQLGEGFLKLTKAELTPAVPAAAPPAPVRANTVRTSAFYTSDNPDVVPPVDLVRELPAWNPPPPFERRTFTGVLQIDIDEHGFVEHATVLQPIMPAYDNRLLAASRTWRFQPAMKDGVSVKYRKTLSVVLHPSAN
jgi:tetratricopeptide (TPR) repeat protein